MHFDKTTNHKLKDATLKDSGSDGIIFSWHGIHKAIQGDHILVKEHGKQLAPDQETLICWLFGDKNHEVSHVRVRGAWVKMKRKYFLKSDFRTAYHYSRSLSAPCGFSVAGFDRVLKEEFFAEHWVVPYPDTNGTLSSTTKEGNSWHWRWFHVDCNTDGLYNRTPRTGNPPKSRFGEMLCWSSLRLEQRLNKILSEGYGRAKTLPRESR